MQHLLANNIHIDNRGNIRHFANIWRLEGEGGQTFSKSKGQRKVLVKFHFLIFKEIYCLFCLL